MSHVYCPECGFQNPESANYCSKCGALLTKDEPVETTMQFTPEEGEVDAEHGVEDAGIKGPALIVRSASGTNVSPALPPPDRTTSAGPLIPASSRPGAVSRSPSSGVNCIVVSTGSSLVRSAPHFEQ